MRFFSRLSNPTAVRDMITGVTYPYEVGDNDSRLAAEVAAKAAQDAVILSLGLPANKDSDLVNLQLAYAASQE
jgi:hypothetical protein